MCNKKKRTNLLFGHYVFYHNLSIQALKDCLDKASNIKINGSSLVTMDNEAEAGSSDKEVCNVCENQINADLNVHEVFCQGFVICDQKECDQIFEDKGALSQHLDQEHPISSCKFGCNETKLKPKDVHEHLQKLHDIVACSLCDIINSSGNLRNHLRDKHSVNLKVWEKALKHSSSKLYRVEAMASEKRVFCNFCDQDITNAIQEFSFVNHYQDQHEVAIRAILRNLDKNPIISDVLMNKRKTQTDDDCLKYFTVVVENSTDEMVEMDFDTSKVFCIGSDVHMEQKPQLTDDETSLISCEFCNKSSFEGTCRLYEHLNESHGFRLLNVSDSCDTCHVNMQPYMEIDLEDNKNFNLSLVCPLDKSFHVTKANFKNHMAYEHLDQSLLMDNIIYKCFECNFAYNKLEDVRKHFLTTHPDIKMTYCRICRFKLSNSNDNSSHFNLNHSEEVKEVKKFCCKLCNKSFAKQYKAKIHYENYHKKKENAKKTAFKCQFALCYEAFDNKEDRKMHQMVSKA